jgi:choice-of-anchor B domain-containing protein
VKNLYKPVLFFFFSTFLPNLQTTAQYVPGVNNNVTLLGHLDDYSVYSNIWGYIDEFGNEYALIGHDAGTSIVNITDPINPIEVDMIPGPTAGGTIWREIKTFNDYAYVVSEHTSPNSLSGIQIIDLRGLPDSVSYVGRYLWTGVNSSNARAHTVAIDWQGYLYIQGGTATLGGSNSGGIRIFDISDPENPVPLGTFAARYVHDVFVQDSIMFAHNIFDFPGRVDIINVANKNNPQLITTLLYNGALSHTSWPTPDLNYLVTTDESTGETMKIFDISVLWDSDPNNNDEIELVSEYIGDPAQIGHEPRVRDGYVFLSHYVEGVKVLDISDPADPVEVGYYDTYPQPGSGFSGDWGVYPFFPSRNFVVSDIQSGLYIFSFDSVSAGGIQGVVTNLTSGNPEPDVELHFVEASKKILTASDGSFSLRTNEGNHTIVLSKPGFFTDTVDVNLPSGPNIIMNFTISQNLAQLNLSTDSIAVNLPVDSTLTEQFTITNSGTSGILNYILDDVVGPLNFSKISKSLSLKKFRDKLPVIKIENNSKENQYYPDLRKPNQGFEDTIIVDPAGDLVFGTGGDIVGVYGTINTSTVSFGIEFLNTVILDSTYVLLSLDTDFNSHTGAFPGGFGFNLPEQNVGVEWDVIIDIPGNFTSPPQPLTYYIFVGSNNPPSGTPSALGPVSVNDRIVSISINLNTIIDDGNMAVAGFGGHYNPQIGLTSADFIPDIGHGILGVNPFEDLPWLSLSPEEGSLSASESEIIDVTFNSAGLVKNQLYTGYITVTTNDLQNPFVIIPVTMYTGDPSSIQNEDENPRSFSLEQNYPNPFNPSTTIKYSIPTSEFVTFKVYDVLGNEVATLIDEYKPAGSYEIEFDGNGLSSGIYFYKLQAGSFTETKKMILMK